MAAQVGPAPDQSSSLSIPVLVNFLSVVPVPLTTVLVGLAPYISTIRRVTEIVSWRSPWTDSWLVLAMWWAVCLLSELSLRYLLPMAILFILAVIKWTTRPHSIAPPITEQTLESIVSDLIIIKELIPASPMLPIISPETLRVAAILYLPYLLLTYLVRLRVLLGIAGTILLSWRAPWASTIRKSLWRSAWVRWSAYRTWSVLAGAPLPPIVLSPQSTSTFPQPGTDKRFVFIIHENQRWWVTLDWTPSLFPSERPSWCSRTHDPVSPPSAFTLPEPTTVFLVDGRGRRVKRAATWRWEEREWRVLVKKDGWTTRVEKPLPTASSEAATGSKSSKAAGKMKQSLSNSEGAGTSVSSPKVTSMEEMEASVDDSANIGPEEPATDADGWVYFDNKWEAPSNSNKMGKFTRSRRWSRVAVVNEVVEVVEPGEVGIQSPSVDSSMVLSDSEVQSPISTTKEVRPDTDLLPDAESEVAEGHGGRRRATLRQRMQNSLRKGTVATDNIS